MKDCDLHRAWKRPVSPIPQCTCPISHNKLFMTKMHIFILNDVLQVMRQILCGIWGLFVYTEGSITTRWYFIWPQQHTGEAICYLVGCTNVELWTLIEIRHRILHNPFVITFPAVDVHCQRFESPWSKIRTMIPEIPRQFHTRIFYCKVWVTFKTEKNENMRYETSGLYPTIQEPYC